MEREEFEAIARKYCESPVIHYGQREFKDDGTGLSARYYEDGIYEGQWQFWYYKTTGVGLTHEEAWAQLKEGLQTPSYESLFGK